MKDNVKQNQIIAEQLKIMLEHINIIDNDPYVAGLCSLAVHLHLGLHGINGVNDSDAIKQYIRANRPWNLYWVLNMIYPYKHIYKYFWKPRSQKPRVKWLRKHIRKLSAK